jgi:hypothetical protein
LGGWNLKVHKRRYDRLRMSCNRSVARISCHVHAFCPVRNDSTPER